MNDTKLGSGVNEIPRRCRIDKWTPAERAIADAVDEVEMMGADPRLTEAVTLLGKARNLVADYFDEEPTLPLEQWIKNNFGGLGRAVREKHDPPLPGEPYMSMSEAKDLVRAAVAWDRGHRRTGE